MKKLLYLLENTAATPIPHGIGSGEDESHGAKCAIEYYPRTYSPDARWFAGMTTVKDPRRGWVPAPLFTDIFQLARKFDFITIALTVKCRDDLDSCAVTGAWFEGEKFLYLEDTTK